MDMEPTTESERMAYHLEEHFDSEAVSTTIQEAVDSDAKKKKKFRQAENLWCFSIADHRYDTREPEAEQTGINNVNIASDKPATYMYWDENCELLADIYSHGRATKSPDFGERVTRYNKGPKTVKQLKDVHYRAKRVKHMNNGSKLLVKSDVYSRKIKRDDNMTEAIEARKQNVENTLKRKDLKRRGINVKLDPTVQTNSTTTTTNQTPHNKTRSKLGGRRKARWSPERKEDRVIYWEAYPYALDEADLALAYADKSDQESQLLWILMELQHRELSPEDYDILLQLDDKVAAKTVSEEKLKSLTTQTLTDSDLTSVEVFQGPCSICMDSYDVSQIVKFLPNCKHVFHELCIDNWLKNSATNCPLDGLEVDL